MKMWYQTRWYVWVTLYWIIFYSSIAYSNKIASETWIADEEEDAEEENFS